MLLSTFTSVIIILICMSYISVGTTDEFIYVGKDGNGLT